jgi:transposase
MVNIETGKVVDILNSRDYADVKEWLDKYPNIEVVCRDGSVTYAKAVKDAHNTAIQISDRFHLLKNLTDYCKEYIKRTIKHNVDIEVTVLKTFDSKDIPEIKKKYKYQTKWDLISAVKQMCSDGYTIVQICQILGIGNKSAIKYSNIDNCEKEKI